MPSPFSEIRIARSIRIPPKMSKKVGNPLKNNIPRIVAPMGSPRIVIAIKVGEKNFKDQLKMECPTIWGISARRKKRVYSLKEKPRSGTLNMREKTRRKRKLIV